MDVHEKLDGRRISVGPVGREEARCARPRTCAEGGKLGGRRVDIRGREQQRGGLDPARGATKWRYSLLVVFPFEV